MTAAAGVRGVVEPERAGDAGARLPLLEIRDLRVEFPTRRKTLVAVDGVSLSIARGEVLGVVGESGAGKSLTGAAIIGLLEPPGRIAGGEIVLDGRRIDRLPEAELRPLRGRQIGAIFQDPLTSLNPLYTVGRQLVETITTHLGLSASAARRRAIDLLAETGIAAPQRRIDHYPHQFSGGMRQRVVIALALAAEPKLVIADEPTTALDVSVQAQIIALLKRLCREHHTAIMLITHDMGVIAETADRVAVMYAGRVAEVGAVADIVHRPRHPYTVGLMGSIPSLERATARLIQIEGTMPRLDAIPGGCAFHPRCPHAFERCRSERPQLAPAGASSAACWLHVPGAPPAPEGGCVAPAGTGGAARPAHAAPPDDAGEATVVRAEGVVKTFDVSPPWLNRVLERRSRQFVRAVDGVSFEIGRGETVSLVGESGCGKSTVARLLVGLYRPASGRIDFFGRDLAEAAGPSGRQLRQRLQMIFQDPYASLNPRWRVADIVAEPLRVHQAGLGRAAIDARVDELLELVRLSPLDRDKYPHQFSGGQRQRVSIARALASNPRFLVCDEPTSALDVSVQAQVLNLMKDLQRELGLTYLFISHNLAVVRHLSDRVGVMYLGRLVELAATSAIFASPRHPYTRMLLDAIPDLHMTGRPRTPVSGEVPNPLEPPPGCAFNPRCPYAQARCRSEVPQMRPVTAGHQGLVACHAVEEGRLA